MQSRFGRNKTNLPTYLGGASQWEQTPYPARSRNPASATPPVCMPGRTKAGSAGSRRGHASTAATAAPLALPKKIETAAEDGKVVDMSALRRTRHSMRTRTQLFMLTCTWVCTHAHVHLETCTKRSGAQNVCMRCMCMCFFYVVELSLSQTRNTAPRPARGGGHSQRDSRREREGSSLIAYRQTCVYSLGMRSALRCER